MTKVNQIIKESMDRNPLGIKEALEEELRNRIAVALEEAKTVKEDDDDEDDDEDDEEDLDENAKVTHKWYSVRDWKDGDDRYDDLEDYHHEREDKKFGPIKWGGDSKHPNHKDYHIGVPIANKEAIWFMDKNATATKK